MIGVLSQRELAAYLAQPGRLWLSEGHGKAQSRAVYCPLATCGVEHLRCGQSKWRSGEVLQA